MTTTDGKGKSGDFKDLITTTKDELDGPLIELTHTVEGGLVIKSFIFVFLYQD